MRPTARVSCPSKSSSWVVMCLKCTSTMARYEVNTVSRLRTKLALAILVADSSYAADALPHNAGGARCSSCWPTFPIIWPFFLRSHRLHKHCRHMCICSRHLDFWMINTLAFRMLQNTSRSDTFSRCWSNWVPTGALQSTPLWRLCPRFTPKGGNGHIIKRWSHKCLCFLFPDD